MTPRERERPQIELGQIIDNRWLNRREMEKGRELHTSFTGSIK
jgi:hypothetical protein